MLHYTIFYLPDPGCDYTLLDMYTVQQTEVLCSERMSTLQAGHHLTDPCPTRRPNILISLPCMDAGPPASQTQALSDKHLEWAPAAKGPIYKELHILDGSKTSPDFKVGQCLGLLSGCLIHGGVWSRNLQWGALRGGKEGEWNQQTLEN